MVKAAIFDLNWIFIQSPKLSDGFEVTDLKKILMSMARRERLELVIPTFLRMWEYQYEDRNSPKR